MPDIGTSNTTGNTTKTVPMSKHSPTILIKDVHDQSNLVVFKHKKAHANGNKEKNSKSYESHLNSVNNIRS